MLLDFAALWCPAACFLFCLPALSTLSKISTIWRSSMSQTMAAFMAQLKQRDPVEPEFHQAVQEVVESI